MAAWRVGNGNEALVGDIEVALGPPRGRLGSTEGWLLVGKLDRSHSAHSKTMGESVTIPDGSEMDACCWRTSRVRVLLLSFFLS